MKSGPMSPYAKAWEGKHTPISKREEGGEWLLARHLAMSITEHVCSVFFQNNLLLTCSKLNFLSIFRNIFINTQQ